MNTDVIQVKAGPAEDDAASPVGRQRGPLRHAGRWTRIMALFTSERRAVPHPGGKRGVPLLVLVVAGKVIPCLIVAVATGLLVMHLREAALVEAEKEFERTSLILTDQAERAFEAIDLLETDLLERLKDSGVQTPQDFRQAMTGIPAYDELRARARALPQLEAITAIDENGKLINFSRYWPIPGVNVADRDYFKVLKADPDRTTFIGQPVPNRGTGTWSMYFARKVVGPHGEFLGLILGAIQLSYFEDLYRSVARGDGMALSLFRQDGILLARHPHVAPRIGQSFATGGVFDRLQQSQTDSLIVRQPGALDGVDKLIAARLVKRFPIVVTVAAPVSSVLEEWRKQATYLIGTAALLELMMMTVGLLVTRQLRGQAMLHDARAAGAEAEAARRGAEAELALAHERERVTRDWHVQGLRFEAALNNMTQALAMFDASDMLIMANRRLPEMFGVPSASIASGMSVQTLLGSVAAGSNLNPSDIATMLGSFQQFKIDRKPAARLRELADGRALAVNFAPVEDDGWLVTFEDVTERRLVEARIAHMAHHDALTGLPNRVLFHEKLAEAVARSRRGEPGAVLYLDLDHFKAVNDTLGHPVGDALLREVTRRLKAQVREIDTVARLGGDEFAVVQSGIDQPKDAMALATRLIDVLGAPYDVDGQELNIGTSVGIAVFPGDGDNPDQLLKNADMALYRAKADGRGRYRFFEPEMDVAVQERRVLERDLRKALAEGEFRVFYQPLMNVQSRSLTGFEALVRWFHPQRGLVSPVEFIPLAEEIGLIVPLGEWVLRQACADAAGWPGSPKVAVNLSPVQFGSRTLVADVASALAQSGLDPARLELEITETVMLEDTDAVLVILHQLRDLGVGIAMDDFGTGYSSLSYLRRFPFSKVKIDRSFVEGMGQGGDCDTIIAAVADLCKRLGMITTAEGVETDDQLARLALGECTEAQGYLFSQPRPADEVAGLCARLTKRTLAEVEA